MKLFEVDEGHVPQCPIAGDATGHSVCVMKYFDCLHFHRKLVLFQTSWFYKLIVLRFIFVMEFLSTVCCNAAICLTHYSRQMSKLGSVGENADDDDLEESSDDDDALDYMSNTPSFLKSQQRPKSPSNI